MATSSSCFFFTVIVLWFCVCRGLVTRESTFGPSVFSGQKYVGSAYPSKLAEAESPQHCGIQCLQIGVCLSFNYGPENRCELFADVAETPWDLDDASDARYYQIPDVEHDSEMTTVAGVSCKEVKAAVSSQTGNEAYTLAYGGKYRIFANQNFSATPVFQDLIANFAPNFPGDGVNDFYADGDYIYFLKANTSYCYFLQNGTECTIKYQNIRDQFSAALPYHVDAFFSVTGAGNVLYYYGIKDDTVYSDEGVFSINDADANNMFYGAPSGITAAMTSATNADEVFFFAGANYYIYRMSTRAIAYIGNLCFV